MKTYLLILSLLAMALSGCSTLDAIIRTPEKVFTTQKPVVYSTPAPIQIPAVNITIRQGVTTKQQILNQLGQPDNYVNVIGGDLMTYKAYDNARIINLRYIEKSGTTLSYTISQAQNTKKSINIGINQLNNTVGSISVF